MTPSKTATAVALDRRSFLKTGVAAALGSVATGTTGTRAAPPGEPSNDPKAIAARPFGKTGRTLPILAYGGAALPQVWGNPLSAEDRVKLVRHVYDRGLRYFDTAGDVAYTLEDRALLAEYMAKAYDTEAIRGMKIE